MRDFAQRHPLLFALSILAALVGLTLVARTLLPSAPIGDVSGLSPEALKPPSPLQQAITAIKNADNLFWVLALALAALLLTALGWWREAGFRAPRWRKLYLLVFPLAVCAFALSDGFLLPDKGPLVAGLLVVFIAAIGEEAVFRGLLWRVFVPRGPVWAVVVTSLLTGALYLARSTNDALPEAIRLSAVAACGGFTYGALRWRTASIWPVVGVHAALAYVPTVAALGSTKYPILVWISTLGFVLYGLLLLRNRRVRADGR
ncbi:MAG TPA: CPBP family intramembrane glutamic endopeptidase [Rubrobacteraceae bacterium]|nr:CPBP family intramembrane glutamic endopeptidase [Rubrobacteraceae bacterium]